MVIHSQGTISFTSQLKFQISKKQTEIKKERRNERKTGKKTEGIKTHIRNK
jgi:hypothetical protein